MSYRKYIRDSRKFVAALAVALAGCFTLGTAQAGTINWGPAKSATIDSPYGGVVTGAPDDSTGGFIFSKGRMTKFGSDADMIIGNNGIIGAAGIALSRKGFKSTSEADRGSYLGVLRIKNEGDLFVILLKNGKHAKIRIDKLTPGEAWFTYSKITFSYRLQRG